MDATIRFKTARGFRDIPLKDCATWFLDSEVRKSPDHKLRQQALQILKEREEQKLRETEKNLASHCQLKQNEVLQSPSTSLSDSDSLSKQSESSQSSLASSSESFSSKQH